MYGAEWNKLVTLVIVNIGTIILCYAGKIPGEATVAVLSASLGYVFGNGHGILTAKRANGQDV